MYSINPTLLLCSLMFEKKVRFSVIIRYISLFLKAKRLKNFPLSLKFGRFVEKYYYVLKKCMKIKDGITGKIKGGKSCRTLLFQSKVSSFENGFFRCFKS